MLDFGGFLEPSSGAQVQRINRLGSRYAVTVNMPPLENRKDGRVWVNRLIKGQQEGARIEYPLLDFYPGTPGSFVVDGAGQAGKSLKIMGGTPHYAFYEGQPFSIEIAGQHYFDFIATTAVADASGSATIALTQMLRAAPANGDTLHISKPMIEGFIMGDQLSWEIALERMIGLSFEIHEAR
ncbi:hypothetical protein [Sphingobium chungbukense]|uniref:hypothetical protein n=1 Tax=Sphingobium chungbukense TaxID=56193 RepID=UPI000AFE170D|nr:hypothetical protein [Sphingobium chungbukense]